MVKNNFNQRRTELATSLRNMGTLLNRHGVCIDVSPLHSAAAQVATGNPRNRFWSYDIQNLAFRVAVPRSIAPKYASDFRIDLSLRLSGDFTADAADQFTAMEINVEKYAQGATGQQLKSAWHFDRHIIDTSTDDPYMTDDIHPLYHFQFGGANMGSISQNLGGTFLVDPPRLMHPPMDGILAIDFVLSNYEGKTWKALREEHQYMNLVDAKLAQIWKPFFSSVSNSWTNPREHLSRYLCPTVNN